MPKLLANNIGRSGDALGTLGAFRSYGKDGFASIGVPFAVSHSRSIARNAPWQLARRA